MQRFFFSSTSLQPQSDIDLQPFSHQINTVLRLQVGAQIVLVDGQGSEFLTELTAVGRGATRGVVLEQRPACGEPSLHLTLYQCSLKADKFEWVLQKGTELGVACFAPVISARSIVRPADALLRKYDRWQAILSEAGSRERRSVVRWFKVRPLSIISSTMSTWRPEMLVSMSLEIRTMPEVLELFP